MKNGVRFTVGIEQEGKKIGDTQYNILVLYIIAILLFGKCWLVIGVFILRVRGSRFKIEALIWVSYWRALKC